MVPLNSKYGLVVYISLTLLLLSIVGCFFLFKKQKEYYVIKAVDVKAVQLNGDSMSGYTISPFKVESKKIAWGISVQMFKEYVSGEDSPRQLFGGSMEPGVNGIKSRINHFDIVYKKDNRTIILNDFFIAKDYGLSDQNTSGDAINILYSGEVSLSQFITDINNNVKYTKGISFNESVIYFWYKNTSDAIYYLPPNKKLLIDIQSEDLQITKTLIEEDGRVP